MNSSFEHLPECTTYPDAESLAQNAALAIRQTAESVILKRQQFRIVLAGGSTPGRVYQLLAQYSCDWSRWQIYLGDERCLPADHPERNSRMIYDNWLSDITIPANNIHFIRAELGPEKAAIDYQQTILKALPFDMVLLGMGEDGHTASLFPGQQHDPAEAVHAVHNAPKPPAERVSLSSSSLSNTREVLFLISGKGKKPALTRWKHGAELPISQIHALDNTRILVDQAASPDSA